eukprot:TRINITY_DN3185_c0_g2_i1.p1 TRINITY_DN3185_c0_g2~~TRINITY_DN3185_c0_g2_i1.p1  ORF type:complete len:162 (-),score=13.35 TRINITY_DN3185_c0_g2_i1:217-702(-)
MINKSVRRMERERRKLLSTEKKYLAELKVLARQNNHSAAKILIKDLTRLRKQCDQYLLMQSQLKSIGFQVSTLQAQTEVNAALRGATETMTRVNETMDVKEIQEVMKQFVRNVEKMGVNMDLVMWVVSVDGRCSCQWRICYCGRCCSSVCTTSKCNWTCNH